MFTADEREDESREGTREDEGSPGEVRSAADEQIDDGGKRGEDDPRPGQPPETDQFPPDSTHQPLTNPSAKPAH